MAGLCEDTAKLLHARPDEAAQVPTRLVGPNQQAST